MGTYDTIGGAPRHDPAFDHDPPCAVCGLDPYGDFPEGKSCNCSECLVCGGVGDPRCFAEHGLTLDLYLLDPDHRLRNAPLSEIGAEYRSAGTKTWRRVGLQYRIAGHTFNELGESWVTSTEWRATKC